MEKEIKKEWEERKEESDVDENDIKRKERVEKEKKMIERRESNYEIWN
jgi:hypothetical protein